MISTKISSSSSVNPESHKPIWHLTFSGRSERPTLLWLHGFMGSASDWSELVNDHFKDYHNILADLPGHGESTLSAKESYPSLANDLFYQLSSAGIDNFVPIGYSMGGRFALHFQKRYPCHIPGLIGISTGPGLKTEPERTERSAADEALISRMKESRLPGFLDSWYRLPLFQSIYENKPLLEELIRTRADNDPEQLALALRLLGNGALYSLWDYLPDLDIPILLLSGGLDSKYCSINQDMITLLPKGEHEIIEDGDHAFHLEKPLETAILIRNFLRELFKGE